MLQMEEPNRRSAARHIGAAFRRMRAVKYSDCSECQILCLKDKFRKAILLLVLGSADFLHHGFAWYSGLIGPKLDPTFRQSWRNTLHFYLHRCECKTRIGNGPWTPAANIRGISEPALTAQSRRSQRRCLIQEPDLWGQSPVAGSEYRGDDHADGRAHDCFLRAQWLVRIRRARNE
jgi:hypothetical protein